MRGKVRLLMVLPTDIHQALSQDLRDRLGKYVLDLEERGFLKDPEFIAAVVMEYARDCIIDNAKELAGEILGRFSEGYTLIARLTGTLIASKYECRVDDVERIIKESRGNAHYLILRYINSLFKIHEDPKMAEALVEIFVLRRPFVNFVRPGTPILTPGVIELIGKNEKRETRLLYSAAGEELRGWLAIRQHDLIEEAIEKLLDCVGGKGEGCEVLGDAPKPWKTIGVIESLRKASEKVKDVDSAVEYFTSNYGEKLTNTLKLFSNCWKRAALIIGLALAGDDLVLRLEDLSECLRKDFAESLGDALRECGVDDYLLVDGVIPPLIMNLIKNHARDLAKAFINKYREAVNEINRILNKEGGINPVPIEEFYGLGLALIITSAAESDESVKPSDTDAALRMASLAIQDVVSPGFIKPVLGALEPLCGDKTLHRYLELLVSALNKIGLNRVNFYRDTVEYILNKFDYILNEYDDKVKGRTQILIYAIYTYIVLLNEDLKKYDDYMIEHMVASPHYTEFKCIINMINKLDGLLDKINRLNPNLSTIAWVHVLTLALMNERTIKLIERVLGFDVVDKAGKVLEELSRLREKVKELMMDEEFVDYVKSWYNIKADEEAVKKAILEAASYLRHALAQYRLDNDELDKAEERGE